MRILLIVILLFFASCNNDKTTTIETGTSNKSTSEPTPAGEAKKKEGANSPVIGPSINCYMRTSGRDTVLLRFEQTGNSISGRLMFDNYQIDGSSGNVKGSIEGEIIELWYDFEAEGMRSVRQLFFKNEAGRLLWGKGEQVSRNDSTLYTDVNNITYSEYLLLKKVECDKMRF